jgi:hypothetical protein
MYTSRRPAYSFMSATKPRGELLPTQIDDIEQAILSLLAALRTSRKG